MRNSRFFPLCASLAFGPETRFEPVYTVIHLSGIGQDERTCGLLRTPPITAPFPEDDGALEEETRSRLVDGGPEQLSLRGAL